MSQFVEDFSILGIEYFNHYFLDNTYVFEGHRHNSWEINVVLDGKIEITYEDVIFAVSKAEVFIGEPNAFHRNRVIEDSSVELLVLHFYSDDLPILCLPRVFALNSENLELFKLAVLDYERFCKAKLLTPEAVTAIPFSFKKLLEVFIARILKENIHIPYSNRKETIVYNKAVTYMKEHLHSHCSVPEIATECCVCNTTLKNIFKKYTGQGVNTFFINMKLEHSKQYLQQGYSIAAISELLGFTSQAYFSQTFKKVYGCSPLKYK